MPDTFQNDLNDPNDQKCWTFLLKNSKVAHIEPLLFDNVDKPNVFLPDIPANAYMYPY